jgi:uncharacterized protein (DUF2141 family)
MKRLFIGFSLAFLFSYQVIPATKTIHVIVDGFKEKKGKLMIGIYNSESTFMKKTYKGFAADVIDTTLEFTLELPEGEYAISVYHDVNENRKMDTGLLGIPTESYGFSNNVKGRIGPPGFEKAKFSVAADSMVVRINLFH